MKPLLIFTAFAFFFTTLPAQPGAIDLSFNPTDPGFDSGSGAQSVVLANTLQPDGKVIIGGGFTSYNGISCNHIARLNADGSFDHSFDTGMGAVDRVWATAVQPDGKIIAGGNFWEFDGAPVNFIVRLNADGSIDTTFQAGSGPDNGVFSLALQPDGKIIIGGRFNFYDGIPRNNIARLHPDGSFDESFDPGAGASKPVMSAALQADGRIIIAGQFTSYNGTGRNRAARLLGDNIADAREEGAASFRVFPNPATDVLFIETPHYKDSYRWQLIDAAGKLAREGRSALPVYALPVSGFAPGIYSLKLMDEAGRLLRMEKVTLQR